MSTRKAPTRCPHTAGTVRVQVRVGSGVGDTVELCKGCGAIKGASYPDDYLNAPEVDDGFGPSLVETHAQYGRRRRYPEGAHFYVVGEAV